MMPQIKGAEAGLKNSAFILFHAAAISSRGIDGMDGKMLLVRRQADAAVHRNHLTEILCQSAD